MSAAPARWKTLPPLPALPAGGRAGRAGVNGIELFHAVYGEGEPVLLLHGGTGSAEVWAHLVADLARDRQVVVADTRGHGRSTRGDEPLSFALFTRDILALLDQLGLERVHLVGTSDGAIIGLAMALDHRGRLLSVFAHGPNVTPDGQDPSAADTPVFKAHAAQARAFFERVAPDPAGFDALSRELGALYEREPQWSDERLAAITTPILLALGDHDEDIPMAHVAHAAAAIPSADLTVLTGTSHFPMLQDPEGFNRAVRGWLADRGGWRQPLDQGGASGASPRRTRIALFGDSVFAGYGLAPHETPAAHLQHLLPDAEIVAAGFADETAADGLARVAAVEADIVVVEFGLNDSIEGIPAERTGAALKNIVRQFRSDGSRVMLAEARIPATSKWPAKADQDGLAARVASECGIGFVPDILGVAGSERQADGLHPTAEGARRIAAALADQLRTLNAS